MKQKLLENEAENETLQALIVTALNLLSIKKNLSKIINEIIHRQMIGQNLLN